MTTGGVKGGEAGGGQAGIGQPPGNGVKWFRKKTANTVEQKSKAIQHTAQAMLQSENETGTGATCRRAESC